MGNAQNYINTKGILVEIIITHQLFEHLGLIFSFRR